jgi:hypothetical protein
LAVLVWIYLFYSHIELLICMWRWNIFNWGGIV